MMIKKKNRSFQSLNSKSKEKNKRKKRKFYEQKGTRKKMQRSEKRTLDARGEWVNCSIVM